MRRNVDFGKEFQFSFGSYVIANQGDSPMKNNPKPQGRDCIYLRASKSIQGGHQVLNLSTWRIVERPKVVKVTMTNLVIKAVNDIVKGNGLKSHKFFNRKRELITYGDLLEGVSGKEKNKSENLVLNDGGDPHQGHLPTENLDELFALRIFVLSLYQKMATKKVVASAE